MMWWRESSMEFLDATLNNSKLNFLNVQEYIARHFNIAKIIYDNSKKVK